VKAPWKPRSRIGDSGPPPAPLTTEQNLQILRRLLVNHVRPHVGRMSVAATAMVATAAATAGMAWLTEPLFDWIFTNREPWMLYLMAGGIVVAAGARGFGSYIQAIMLNRVGQRIIADIQARMFAHVIHSDLAYFHENPPGRLISRFINDVNMLRGAVTQSVIGMTRDALTAFALIGLLFYQDWKLALIASVGLPAAMFPIIRVGRRIQRVSTNSQIEVGNFAALLDETFQGARHVKAYGMEAYEAARAQRVIERIFVLVMKATKIRALATPFMEIIASTAMALVIAYAGTQVLTGETTPGRFFSFVAAMALAYQPIKNLVGLNATLMEGLAAASRVFALLDILPAVADRPGALPLPPGPRQVRFENVSFDYGYGQQVLHSLSLELSAGKTVALVGPSGGGKSTIANLIPRFYDVTEGRLLIDGMDVRDVTLESLRADIAIVSQEVSLFHDTVRANISYGRPEAEQQEIEHAALLAGAADFIAELPNGYDTVVGPRGVKLSGGQRQRVAIARALLKNAPILLLDEATSALDNETERQVQAALNLLMEGRTTLVIAHRLSTIVDADLIYVIEHGRAVECGRHAELMARRGVYARLYAEQEHEMPIQMVQAAAAIRARM
jgi:ATP-binding cassette, subfamily B, bacterial MsbA